MFDVPVDLPATLYSANSSRPTRPNLNNPTVGDLKENDARAARDIHVHPSGHIRVFLQGKATSIGAACDGFTVPHSHTTERRIARVTRIDPHNVPTRVVTE